MVFDPVLSTAQLSNNAFYSTDDDPGVVDSVLKNVESEFRQRVDMGFRLDTIRSPETHAVETGGHHAYRSRFSEVRTDYTAAETDVELSHSPVLPIDSAEGDSIEVRRSPGDWEDITADEGDLWELVSTTQGLLLVNFDRVHSTQGVGVPHHDGRRFVRVSYRYGASGGRSRLAGQTTLGEILSQGDTPSDLSVDDASKLPPAPATLLVADESDPAGTGEYIEVTSVDTTNDELAVASRGERLTSDVEHASGETVHYAPLFVRDAVASKAAVQLTENDQYSEWLPETDIPLDAPRKIDEWRNAWNSAISLLS